MTWTSTCRAALILLLTLGLALTVDAPRAAGDGEPGPVITARIDLADKQTDLALLRDMRINVDGVFDGWARVYLVPEELSKLRALGLQVSLMPELAPLKTEEFLPVEGAGGGGVPAAYHTYDSLKTELEAIAAAHPSITQLVTIGQSVQGRDLMFLKISDNVTLEEDEPEFCYISSMHGDEIVGKEMLYNLIVHLTDNYGTDPRVTDLIDNTELWIMPSMNPDGSAENPPRRYNANNYDLNRNFPDQFVDPVNSGAGRQPETQAVMAWALEHSINLAANMHGGALVANYPFDANLAGAEVFSPAPAPDHDAYVSISRTYADNNPPMSTNSGGSFDNGITNGAHWYVVYGGMQDWNYVWNGAFEVTLELGNDKTPPGSSLPTFWTENQESMLAYLERVHEGVRGIVTDVESGLPLPAKIEVDGNGFPAYADPDVGDYHRLLLPGSYTIEISAPGYLPQTLTDVQVVAGDAVRHDVALSPAPINLQPVSYRIDDGDDGWLDPGETAGLPVTLQNLGRAATAVGATLVPAGWYGDVMREHATWPDIATVAMMESDAPHHEIHVAPDVPAGHKVGFGLLWQAAQGGGLSEPFFVQVGAPVNAVANDTVSQPVLDHTTTTAQLQITDLLEIDTIRVALDLQHTYIGDLTIDLTSPSATVVRLHNRSGGSTQDIVGTYGVDLNAAEPLGALAGESADGTWTLEIHDWAGADEGTLNGWGVDVAGRPAETSTPEIRLRELSIDAGAVTLDWWSYPGLDSYKVYRSTDASSSPAFVDVTATDGDATDTTFGEPDSDALVFYIVTGVGPLGEGPKGHFGE